MFQDSQSFQESESTMEVDENQSLQEGEYISIQILKNDPTFIVYVYHKNSL